MKSILKDTFYDELTTKEALTSKERRQICHILVTYLIQHYGPKYDVDNIAYAYIIYDGLNCQLL